MVALTQNGPFVWAFPLARTTLHLRGQAKGMAMSTVNAWCIKAIKARDASCPGERLFK